VDRVYDWLIALCKHHPLRRAADDAHLALTYPHEALVFVYRGLEWLKMSQQLEWEELASDVGVPMKHLGKLKKTANYESGVRHATSSGSKMRASADNYGTWVCALVDAINAARARLEPAFEKMSAQEVSKAILRAMPVVPYP
jgi:hypothetical protein